MKHRGDSSTMMVLAAALVVLMSAVGCEGALQSDGAAAGAGLAMEPDDHRQVVDPDQQEVIGPEDEVEQPPPKPSGPSFLWSADGVKLLPFEVRMRRLEVVTGLGAEDEAFGALRASRYELGDYDHSRNVRADLTWNASKVALWIKGLKPLCGSQAFRDRYPSFPASLDDLALAAYGRRLEPGEADGLMAPVRQAEPALDEAVAHRTICLGMLTSAEFVAQ